MTSTSVTSLLTLPIWAVASLVTARMVESSTTTTLSAGIGSSPPTSLFTGTRLTWSEEPGAPKPEPLITIGVPPPNRPDAGSPARRLHFVDHDPALGETGLFVATRQVHRALGPAYLARTLRHFCRLVRAGQVDDLYVVSVGGKDDPVSAPVVRRRCQVPAGPGEADLGALDPFAARGKDACRLGPGD